MGILNNYPAVLSALGSSTRIKICSLSYLVWLFVALLLYCLLWSPVVIIFRLSFVRRNDLVNVVCISYIVNVMVQIGWDPLAYIVRSRRNVFLEQGCQLAHLCF